MATQLTSLYSKVEPELPFCPEPLILDKIRDVMIEFCNETRWWREDLDPINVLNGAATYDLDGQPAIADIIVPTYVELDSVEQKPGIDYTMESRTQLTLVVEPVEDIANGLEVRVALRPKTTATTICDEVYQEWYQTFAAGVKSVLMKMPNKKWTDTKMAARYNQEYWDGVAKARISANRGRMDQPLLAVPKYAFI